MLSIKYARKDLAMQYDLKTCFCVAIKSESTIVGVAEFFWKDEVE